MPADLSLPLGLQARLIMRHLLTLLASSCLALVHADGEDLSPHRVLPSPRHSGEERIVFDSSNVQLLGWVTITGFPGSNTSSSDSWGYTSPSGREYAVIGLSNG